jgi:DNA-binding Xre family transcriptional regulator
MAMMIKNERQYRSALATLRDSERGIETVRAESSAWPESLRIAQMDVFLGNIEELRQMISAYESVRDGTSPIEIKALADLPMALIKTRIRRGWTQAHLAVEIGAHEQQVQRWEEHEYQNVQFETIERVAHALGLEVFEPA